MSAIAWASLIVLTVGGSALLLLGWWPVWMNKGFVLIFFAVFTAAAVHVAKESEADSYNEGYYKNKKVQARSDNRLRMAIIFFVGFFTVAGLITLLRYYLALV